MDQEGNSRIYLTGFSTTGKSTVGRIIASKIGWRFVDTDDEIERCAGKPIPEIFANGGEERFRELETEVLASLCKEPRIVVCTGGGLVLRQANRELMNNSGVVICLEAKPETIYERLLADSQRTDNPVVRPLLAGENPSQRIVALKEHRQPLYAASDWTVHTDILAPEEVAEEAIRGWRMILAARQIAGEQPKANTYTLPDRREEDAPYCETSGAKAVVHTQTSDYPIFVDWDGLALLGRRMKNSGLTGTAFVVSDSSVFPIYGSRLGCLLEEADFTVRQFVVPAGEKSKNLDVASTIYDWLITEHCERGNPIVALGGGVIGDLAGYVAATYLRGVPFVQVPTTLLAMVDASIGGKVAVDHPKGKNLIGAFYQPRMVVSDIATLSTLPQRELGSGWAEVIKHGLILDAELFETFEKETTSLQKLDPGITTAIISRSADIKARVVTADEKEQGLRMVLNYGHTVAHGLETSTAYGRLLHGEAVAIGMVAAARISSALGMLSRESVERQNHLLAGFGLPINFPEIDVEAVMEAMSVDKKVQNKTIRWILLNDIGKVTVRNNVPLDLVREVLKGLA